MNRERRPPGVEVRSRPDFDALAELARRQGGRVSARQLHALGFGRALIRSLVKRRFLHALGHRVYAVGSLAQAVDGARWFGVLAYAPDGTLSHRTGGAINRQCVDAWKTHVTVTRSGLAVAKHVVLHVSRTMHADDVMDIEGLRVTSPARTLVDLADVCDERAMRKALHESEVARVFDLPKVTAALARAHGRHGAPLLARLMHEYVEEPPTLSELEDMYLELLRRAGVPMPQVNRLTEIYLVDCRWPDRRVVVELDGRSYHATLRGFERDKDRDAKLTIAQWRPQRFSWRQIVHEPELVIATTKALLGLT